MKFHIKIFSIYLLFLLFLNQTYANSNSYQNNTTCEISAVNVNSLDIYINFHNSFDEFRLHNNQNDKVLYQNNGTLISDSYPTLPMVCRFVIVPPQANIEWSYRTEVKELVDSDSLYPPSEVEISEPFIIHGIRFIKLTTYPIQIIPGSNHLVRHRSIEVNLSFTETQNPSNPVIYPHRRISREFLNFLEAFALNTEILKRDYPPIDENKIGHYLVVTHQNCLQYIAPFIEWRRKAGYKMDILSLPDNIARNSRSVKDSIQMRYNAYLNRGQDPFDQLLLVGDRSSYTWPPVAGWVLEAERGESVWAVPQHADYKYALLEGNDNYPDVGFARWCAGEPDILRMFVLRTLAYEAEPYMEDTTWFRRGAAYSQHWGNNRETAWHLSIATAARWAEEVLKSAGFNDVRFYEDFEWDQDGRRVGEFERTVFNIKTNLMLGRAESLVWAQSLAGIEPNNVFPLRIALSGHGEYAVWHLLRGGDSEHLRGPVVATCNWGGPPTLPTNAVWLETIKGMLIYNLSYGWARTFAINASETYFNDFLVNSVSAYAHIKTDNDYYGDPGLKIWRCPPIIVNAEYPRTINSCSNVIPVIITQAINRQPLSNAIVTLYAPGNLPAFNSENYANYNEMRSWSLKTDLTGQALFTFDDTTQLIPNTPLYITITGDNIKPYFGQANIVRQDTSIRLSGFIWEQIQGNGDDLLNPSERLRIYLNVENNGQVDINNLSATVRSISPYISIEGNPQINIGNIPRGQTRRAANEIICNITPNCPDGTARPDLKPKILITFNDNQRNWLSYLSLEIYSPYLCIDNNLERQLISYDRQSELYIELTNFGRITSPNISARLYTSEFGISVIQSNGEYLSISPGSSRTASGQPFIISASRRVPPQKSFKMSLILTANNTIIDTIDFHLQTGPQEANMPSPPDKYGYICLDDTDTNWHYKPTYDWIEINPNDNEADVQGQILPFQGQSPYDIGENVIIRLPFRTSFYGYDVDTITVCSNGYICPGRQPRIVSFQNFPLDQGIGGGAGMIAPFWDRLRWTQDSRILTYHDQLNGIFIIEWYKLNPYYQENPSDQIFQVLLFDKYKYAKETGDPDILFQYRSITNNFNNDRIDNDIPYASVGISSPTGYTGINYTFKNQYPITNAPLTNRRAIRFTTSLRNHIGIATGVVRDAMTRQPIQNATVRTNYGLLDSTDENGRYFISRIVNELGITLYANAPLYFDTSRANIIFNNNDTMVIDFYLRRNLYIKDPQTLLPNFYKLNIFPNPFNSLLNIQFESKCPESLSLELIDLQGRNVANISREFIPAGTQNFTISTEHLTSGIYFLTLYKENEKLQVKKIVLLR